jgi:hypothetical protein
MKTLTTSILLSVMFLSAGAFAGASHTPPRAAAPVALENVTVVIKNQAWPVKGQISMEPCNVRRCIGI